MTITIRSLWDEFRFRVVPANAPALQVIEMRRALYAGADQLLTALMCTLEPGSDPTPNDMKIIEAIHNEIVQFAKDIEAGVV